MVASKLSDVQCGELLPEPTHLPGYYQFSLERTHGSTVCSVWAPVSEELNAAKLNSYELRVDYAKKLTSLSSGKIALGCLPTVAVELKTSLPSLRAISPNMASTDVRAAVLIAHGMSGGRFAVAHIAERLAARGYVVLAPNFSDSGSEEEAIAVTSHGSSFLAELTVLRMHTLERAADYARRTHGVSRLGLIGYSYGCDTIRHINLDGPRVYLAGPGFVYGDLAVCTPPPPRGPSLVLNAEQDVAFKAMKMSHKTALAYTGVAFDEHQQLEPPHMTGASKLSDHMQYLCEGFDHASFKFPAVQAADANFIGKLTCGLVRPPGEDALATINDRAHKTAAVVELFFLQHL